MRWRSLIARDRLNALRDALRIYDAEPVLVPAWPFATEGSAWPGPVGGGITVGWNDGWTSWALNPGTPAAWDYVAPVLRCVLEVEAPTLYSPEVGEVEFNAYEDGSATLALAPAAVTWETGPALNDATTPPIFPLGIDWRPAPRSGAPVVTIERRDIGRAPRSRAVERYPHTGAVTLEAGVVATSPAEVSTLLRWWLDRGGEVAAHYMETGASVTDLTADASAGASALTIAAVADLGAYRYLCVEDGVRAQYVRATSVSGTTVNLAAPLAHAVAAGARVSVAILARHTGDTLELSFPTPGFARGRVAWEELTEEYLPAVEETRGTTLGAGVTKAWLYKITVDRLGAPVTYFRTSYERDLSASAQTWTAAPMKHSDLVRSVRLDRDEVTIDARAEAWANEFLPGRLTARVMLEISECDVSGGTGTNVAPRWAGEIVSVRFEGPFIAAKARGSYALFDRPAPRLVIGAPCNHAVFDSLCGLSRATWTFTAQRVSNSGSTVTLGTWARSGGLPTGWGGANYFALGYIEKGTERFAILRSTALSSGQITLTLDRTPAAWSSGESVNVIPGCDGAAATCRAYHLTTNPGGKFDNFSRFGGFPYVPASNPSFSPPKRTTSDYGKK